MINELKTNYVSTSKKNSQGSNRNFKLFVYHLIFRKDNKIIRYNLDSIGKRFTVLVQMIDRLSIILSTRCRNSVMYLQKKV